MLCKVQALWVEAPTLSGGADASFPSQHGMPLGMRPPQTPTIQGLRIRVQDTHPQRRCGRQLPERLAGAVGDHLARLGDQPHTQLPLQRRQQRPAQRLIQHQLPLRVPRLCRGRQVVEEQCEQIVDGKLAGAQLSAPCSASCAAHAMTAQSQNIVH